MSSTPGYHQLIHTLSYGDAISSEVLALKRVFRMAGFASEIFALNIHPKLKDEATILDGPLNEISGEVLLHYSLGSPLNQCYSDLGSLKRTLVYHNLTPPHWFRGINPRIVADIEIGIKELPHLCEQSDRLIADSKFNASELSALGFKASVLELPVDPTRWNIPANSGIADIVRSEGGIHLLHVGRLAPNKCIEDIIKSFYYLNRYIEPNSRLWLVGIDIDTELYSFGLKRLVRDLNLDARVSFVGCMADSEIKALYENCTVYMCMSEHEGFCLPVVEAMYFNLPVIAYASSALPDTVGAAGILVNQKRHPEIAELISQVASDVNLRERLQRAGAQRVSQLSFDLFAQRVRELFAIPS